MIIYLRGGDSFLALEAIGKLKDKYRQKNPDGTELIEISPTEPVKSWADLKSVPLFASSRLIIIKRAGEFLIDEQNNLASILTDLPASSVVVVWDATSFKAKSALLAKVEQADKIISVEPLTGVALKNWIKTQAELLGREMTTEELTALIDHYGSDLWAIKTDLQTGGGTCIPSSWSQKSVEKPFILFDYVRAQKWPELSRHLIQSFDRGDAIEMTIGSLAAAVRKNVSNNELKHYLTQTLSEIDLALKSGLIEAGDAVALLAYYLAGGHPTSTNSAHDRSLSASQKRVQWEEVYYETL